MKAFISTTATAVACIVTASILGVSGEAMAAQKPPAPAPSLTPSATVTATPVAPSVFAVDQSALDAAATHNGAGSSIEDLAVKDGQVYAGYGDYDANVGPIAINSYDLGSGAATQRYLLDGEDAQAIHVFDGNLYIPDTDSKLSWTAPVGYATDASGAWAYQNIADGSGMEHVFDLAKVGQNIFVAGSMVNPDKPKYGPYAELAVIKASHDGGKTWAIERTQASTDMNNGYDRYYWLGVAGGKVYAQATLDSQAAPLEVWAGGTWTTAPHANINVFAPKTVSLGSKTLFPNGGQVGWFDGDAKGKAATTLVSAVLPAPAGFYAGVDDLYSDGATAYALGRIFKASDNTSSYSSIWRSTDGVTWTKLEDVAVSFPQRYWNHDGTLLPLTDSLSSIAVTGNTIYLGATQGTIYQTPLPPTTATTTSTDK